MVICLLLWICDGVLWFVARRPGWYVLTSILVGMACFMGSFRVPPLLSFPVFLLGMLFVSIVGFPILLVVVATVLRVSKRWEVPTSER